MAYDAVIFDLDGTLTDSGEGIMESAAYALEQVGIPVPEKEELRVFVGPPLSQTFQKFGVEESRIDEAIAAYRRLYTAEGKYKNYPYEGIREVLETLQMQGKHLYVGTSKPEVMAKDILHKFNLDQFFDEIAGAALDHSRDSKEAVLKYLMNKTDLTNAVMVGDTVFDVEGANKLDLPCIGCSWGYGDVEEMKMAGAVSIVNTPAELLHIL